MGCQVKIIDQIIESKANYIVAVKDNQPTLSRNIRDSIVFTKPSATHIQEDFGHGRIEKRICEVYTNLDHIESIHKWRNLKSIIKISSEVTRKSTGVKACEERFYISNLNDAKTINEGIRSHWSIENNLHWSLDVTFREDYSKKQIDNQVQNFNILLKITLALLKKENSNFFFMLVRKSPQKQTNKQTNKQIEIVIPIEA